MSIFLYFVPGIIAAGGMLAYDYFKRVGVAKALQIMSIILYIIGGMIMLPQISGAYHDFMRIMSRADEGHKRKLKTLSCCTCICCYCNLFNVCS